jgi:hypothetical protein
VRRIEHGALTALSQDTRRGEVDVREGSRRDVRGHDIYSSLALAEVNTVAPEVESGLAGD